MVFLCLVFVSQAFWFLLYIIDAICNNYSAICFRGLSFYLWPVFQFHEMLIFLSMQYILFDTDTLKLLLNTIFRTEIFSTIFEYI
jgi:hypothetical protein